VHPTSNTGHPTPDTRLAREIINAQKKEIAQIEAMIERLQNQN
jgi:uncharacterized protein (DUF305 family)